MVRIKKLLSLAKFFVINNVLNFFFFAEPQQLPSEHHESKGIIGTLLNWIPGTGSDSTTQIPDSPVESESIGEKGQGKSSNHQCGLSICLRYFFSRFERIGGRDGGIRKRKGFRIQSTDSRKRIWYVFR